MTINVANTELNNTFEFWRARTNELATLMSNCVITTTANLASAQTAGNAAISGRFSANSLTAANVYTNSVLTVNVSSINSVSEDYYFTVNTTTLTLGNNTCNTYITPISIRANNVLVNDNVAINTSALFVGDINGNLVVNKTSVYIQSNDIVNTVLTSTSFRVSNNNVNSNLTYNTLTIGNVVVNSTSVSFPTVTGTPVINSSTIVIGANVYANTSTLLIGNSTVNSTVNSTMVQMSNSSGTANLTPVHLRIGTSFVNSSIITTGNVTINTTAVIAGSINSPDQAITAYSNNNVTIYSESNSYYAVYGKSNSSVGVSGVSNTGIGVSGSSETSYGVMGSANSGWGGIFTSKSGGSLYAGNNTTEFFRVAVTGYVGIGNASPAHALSINGNVYVLSSVNIATNFVANTAGIYHTGTANLNTLTVGSNTSANQSITAYSNNNEAVVGFSNTNYAIRGISNTSYGVYGVSTSNVGVVGESTSSWGGYFVSTTGNSLFAGNNTTEFFRVASNGNVGVGSSTNTDSRFRVFDVNSNAGIRIGFSGTSVNQYEANTHNFRDTSGNILVTSNTSGVGINNTSFITSDRLSVGGNVYFDSNLRVVTSVNSASFTVGTATISNSTGFWTTGTVNAAVHSVGSVVIANTSGVFVSNSVNANTVRIGSTSVNTSVNSTAFFATNGTQTTTINATSISTNANIVGTGNVDICSGVSGAAYANVRGDLFVRGNLQVSGNLAYTGVAIGDVIPAGNTYNLGNINNRWGLYSGEIIASGNVSTSRSISVNTEIILGNTSTTSFITIVPPNNTQRTQGNTFLSANGSWSNLPTLPITNNAVTTSGTTAQVIDSVLLSDNDAYEWLVNVVDNITTGRRHATKVIATTNSTAMVGTEYATIFNVASLGTFNVSSNATHGLLQYTPVSTSTTVSFSRINT
jgi:hypothetical protein